MFFIDVGDYDIDDDNNGNNNVGDGDDDDDENDDDDDDDDDGNLILCPAEHVVRKWAFCSRLLFTATANIIFLLITMMAV